MPELRPPRLINSGEWGLHCFFFLHATRWHVLKLSINGTPCHPLYLCESLVPVPWRVVENSPIIHRD